MNESNSSFKPDLRISPAWIIALMIAAGVALGLVTQVHSNAVERGKWQDLVLLLFLLALLTWGLNQWQPNLGRWAVIITLVMIVYWGQQWLQLPGFLTLLVIPTALAVALISLPAGFIITIGETVLVLSSNVFMPELEPAVIITSLFAIWAILGVMILVYGPVNRVADWLWNYFQEAQELLEEAQEHRGRLEQVLADLAQANLQMTRLNILAQGLRQAAEEAQRTKEEFVANVSHELRTPLNMIIGFSETILQSPGAYGKKIPPALLADLMVIHRNAGHLSELINDVLDLSQIDADKMALTKEQASFKEIVEEATTSIRPLYVSKGLYLNIDIPGILPPIFCDRTRIREVLLNLLSNAGRFTEQGGVSVRVWTEGNDLMVSVADSGPGIASKDLDKVFQPFQQLDSSIRRRHGGTGLGLTISERFIQLHGGKIWVESQEGSGTTFFFCLPVAPPALSGDSFLRGVTPAWEFLQRTQPYTGSKPVIQPRFVILESGDTLHRLLTRYWDKVETAAVASLEEAITELSRLPAQALLVNETSTDKALEYLNLSQKLPNNTPLIACSIPRLDELNPWGASMRLVKPIFRETLLAALDQLNIKEGTILIVDDEPDALQLFRRMLTSLARDYRILLARDGQEALTILQECRPQVILLDLVMPNMDGFQLLELRRQHPVLSKIPVVIISARDPAGQPIVSSMVAATLGGGLSLSQLLASIEAFSKVLAIPGPVGDPEPTAALSD
ncbi:MAG: response regulator [Anaerolineales bacterium]|nr:response regulator [Anaerolineales bacterium]